MSDVPAYTLRSDKPELLRSIKSRLGDKLAAVLGKKLTIRELWQLQGALDAVALRGIREGWNAAVRTNATELR